MVKTKIDIPIYYGYLVIIFSDDIKQISYRYKLGLGDKKVSAYVQKMVDGESVSQYWIVFDTKHICHTIIAHEVTHCANWIFMDRCINFDYLNDEPYAYLVGWITEKIYKYADKNSIRIAF